MSGLRRAPGGAYLLTVLLAAYVLAFADRQVLNLLAEPVKRELRLSDLQLSLLQGPTFAVFLALAGLPLGRLIDRGRRIGVLAGGVAAWSLATAAGGLAPGYAALLLSRLGVGAGEAAITPGAYSLIGDVVSRRRLGAAVGVFATGPYLGAGLALIGGGALAAALPAAGVELPGVGRVSTWRAVFLLLAAAGAPVALWVASLREPARREAAQAPPGREDVLAYFRARGGAVARVNAAVVFAAMAVYALSAWAPSLLMRRFHMTLPDAGRGFGLVVLLGGAAGALCAGALGDRLRRSGAESGRLGVLALAAALAVPFAAAAPLAAGPGWTLGLLAPLVFLATVAVSCGPALLQEITPNRLRGVQHALAVLAVNLVGLGLGPTTVAFVTDVLLRDEARLGWALATVTPVMLVLSVVFAGTAVPSYRRALRAEADVAPDATAVPG